MISLEKHSQLTANPSVALKETFVKTNTALMTTNINYMFSGCTCVAAYLRGSHLWVANVGDSRAVMAVKKGTQAAFVSKDLSRDHKPDDPEEMARIHQWGGFVAPPREPGLSARVYLDKECTMIGLAMSRSIGAPHFPSISLIIFLCVAYLEFVCLHSQATMLSRTLVSFLNLRSPNSQSLPVIAS